MNTLHRHFPVGDLQRRRQAARRWAWAIGAVVLILYVGGLFVSRG